MGFLVVYTKCCLHYSNPKVQTPYLVLLHGIGFQASDG